MDEFNYLVSMFLIIIAFQFEFNWFVFLIVAAMIISLKSFSATFLLIMTVVVVYIVKTSDLSVYWIPAMVGLTLFSMAMGAGKKAQAPDMYSPYAGLMEGLR